MAGHPFANVDWRIVSANLGRLIDDHSDLTDLAEILGYGDDVTFPESGGDRSPLNRDDLTAELVLAQLIAAGVYARDSDETDGITTEIPEMLLHEIRDADHPDYLVDEAATVLSIVEDAAPVPGNLIVPHDGTRNLFTDDEWGIVFDHIRGIFNDRVGELPLTRLARTKLVVVVEID
jgi:hypothetical protein